MARASKPRRLVVMSEARRKEIRAYTLAVSGVSTADIAVSPWTDGQPMYAQPSGAAEAIGRARVYLASLDARNLEQMRADELAHLRRLRAQTVAAMEGLAPSAHSERNQYTRTLVQIADQISDLMGLDAAVKFEVTGEGGGPIPIEHHVADLRRKVEQVKRLRALPPPD